MAQARDYRTNQSRKDWWNQKIWWLGGITRDNLMWLIIGVIIGSLYLGLPINFKSGVYGPW